MLRVVVDVPQYMLHVLVLVFWCHSIRVVITARHYHHYITLPPPMHPWPNHLLSLCLVLAGLFLGYLPTATYLGSN
jgi:hypothetical protein